MRDHGSRDRTRRLLTAQLETIARASERAAAQRRDLEPHVERAAAATRNAVLLELLTPEEARAIWAGVASRHPGVLRARDWPSVAG
jgi:hypothetical protein